MSRAGLTRQQADLLAFISNYAARNEGASPSYDEMTAHLGYASKGSTHRLVEILEERGAIRRAPGRARSIIVVSDRDRFAPAVEAGIGAFCREHDVGRQAAITAAVEAFFGGAA